METDIINMSRQIDDLKSSNNKKVDAATRDDKLKIEELQRKLKTETDAVAKLHKSLKDQKKQCSDLEITNNDIREQVAQLDETVKSLTRAKTRVESLLEQEKTQGKNRIHDLQDHVKSLQEESERYKKQISKVEGEKKTFSDKLSTLERVKTSMEFEIRTYQKDLEKEVSEHKSTRASLDARNKKYATIEGAKSEAMKGLERQISSEKATRTNLEKETNELRKKITLLEYDLQESQQSQKHASTLKEKVDLELKEVLEAKNLELQQKSQLQTEVTTLKNELSRLMSSESQATKDFTQTRDDKLELEKKLQKMKKERQNIDGQIRELQDQLEAEQYFSTLYKTTVRELKEEIEELKKKLSEGDSDNSNLRDERETLVTQLQLVQDTNTILEQWRSHYEREIVNLQLAKVEAEGVHRQDMSKKEEQIESLEEKIKTYDEKVATLNKSNEEKLEEILQFNKKMDDMGSREDEIATIRQTFESKLKTEKMLKMQAVNKLAEVMNRKDMSKDNRKNKVSADSLRKKEKECRRLEQELRKLEERIGNLTFNSQRDLDELHLALSEEQNRNNELQMQLAGKDANMDLMRMEIQSHSVDSASLYSGDADSNFSVTDTLTGWLSIPNKTNIKKAGYWKKQFVLVSTKKILFYDSENDKEDSNPSMFIDLEKLFHVRPVTQAEAIRAKPQEIPTIFQLLYANEGENRRDQEPQLPALQDELSNKQAGTISHKGHVFIPIVYHLPTNCEVCPKPLWQMFKPPPAIECQRCRAKFHKEHIETGMIIPCKVNITNSAKELLLRATSSEDQKRWVSRLQKKIPKIPPAAPSPNDSFVGRNSPRVASVRKTSQAASRKSSSKGAADRDRLVKAGVEKSRRSSSSVGLNDHDNQSYVITNAGDHLDVADLEASIAKSSSSLNNLVSLPTEEVDRDAFEIQRSSSHSEGFYRSKESKSSLKANSNTDSSLFSKRSPKDGKKSGFLKSAGSKTSLSPDNEDAISPAAASHRKRSAHILNRSDLGPRFVEKEEKEKDKKKKDKRRSWFHQDRKSVV